MELSRDIDAIDNLNTAKMTLRWALERMHALESRAAELQTKLDESRADLGARSSLAREQEAYASNRESYYQKLEPIVSEFCRGRLDLKRLLEREVEAARREGALRVRQEELEKGYAARCDELERKYKRLEAEIEARERQRSEGAERALGEHRKGMDQSYVYREIALRAGEHRLSVQDKALEDARLRLESECAAVKEECRRETARVKEEYLKLKETLFAESRREIHDAELRRGEALERHDRVWKVERDELLSQLRNWEAHSREYLDRIKELEAGKLEDGAQRLADREALNLALEAQRRDMGSRERTERIRLESLFDELKRRQEGLDQLEQLLLKRFEDFEDYARARDEAWVRREQGLRERNKGWREHVQATQEESARVSAQVSDLKAELLETLRSYKKRLAEASAEPPAKARPDPEEG